MKVTTKTILILGGVAAGVWLARRAGVAGLGARGDYLGARGDYLGAVSLLKPAPTQGMVFIKGKWQPAPKPFGGGPGTVSSHVSAILAQVQAAAKRPDYPGGQPAAQQAIASLQRQVSSAPPLPVLPIAASDPAPAPAPQELPPLDISIPPIPSPTPLPTTSTGSMTRDPVTATPAPTTGTGTIAAMVGIPVAAALLFS